MSDASPHREGLHITADQVTALFSKHVPEVRTGEATATIVWEVPTGYNNKVYKVAIRRRRQRSSSSSSIPSSLSALAPTDDAIPDDGRNSSSNNNDDHGNVAEEEEEGDTAMQYDVPTYALRICKLSSWPTSKVLSEYEGLTWFHQRQQQQGRQPPPQATKRQEEVGSTTATKEAAEGDAGKDAEFHLSSYIPVPLFVDVDLFAPEMAAVAMSWIEGTCELTWEAFHRATPEQQDALVTTIAQVVQAFRQRTFPAIGRFPDCGPLNQDHGVTEGPYPDTYAYLFAQLLSKRNKISKMFSTADPTVASMVPFGAAQWMWEVCEELTTLLHRIEDVELGRMTPSSALGATTETTTTTTTTGSTTTELPTVKTTAPPPPPQLRSIPIVLTHGDFCGRNLLIDPKTIALKAIVDWEWIQTGLSTKEFLEGFDDCGDDLQRRVWTACEANGAIPRNALSVSSLQTFMTSLPQDVSAAPAYAFRFVYALGKVLELLPCWSISACLDDPVKFPCNVMEDMQACIDAIEEGGKLEEVRTMGARWVGSQA